MDIRRFVISNSQRIRIFKVILLDPPTRPESPDSNGPQPFDIIGIVSIAPEFFKNKFLNAQRQNLS